MPRHTGIVVTCAAAGFTTLVDSAVVTIGVPSIRESLDAGTADIQWILAGYSLTFGLALVPAGRLGDVVGRRRLFLVGIAVFAVMGVVGALAAAPWMVILARLGQGLGGGVISSQVLGAISGNFDGDRRVRALAAYSATGAAAGLVGPLLGGTLLGLAPLDLGWRYLLVLNVPFALVTLVLGVRYLPRDHAPRGSAGVDLVGLGLLAAATLSVMLPIVSSIPAIVTLPLAAVLAGAFWWWERRYAAAGGVPVLLPALTRSRGYMLGVSIALFWFGSILAINAVVALYLIEGVGLPALQAAFVLSGSSIAMAVSSAFGWRVVARYGRVVVGAAVVTEIAVVLGYLAAVTALSTETFSRSPVTLGLFVALAVLSGTASGFVDAPNRALTLEHSPAGAHGVAAGFLQLSQRLSATVSLAGVSGIYLGMLSRDADNYGRAVGTGLAVCLVLLSLSFVCAELDRRNRRTVDLR
ncbi:MFS transporter [Rhodococcoides trifolii]|uniref:MFS transporter n=1 Tax=Rhodococcoides trifolii TaxID=908250 RepID=A0A917CN18_9NOCA|nr:MFS transporter [Rhodococcus trifolii]GGF94203.1 MFS transporter [Rhodococcus trifolii]